MKKEFNAILITGASSGLGKQLAIDYAKPNITLYLSGRNEKRLLETYKICKSKGAKVVLATNPIFPSYAAESRMRWAGLDKDDFEIYTTYENIGYSKPNLKYYIEIINRLGVQADECIMIGNDVDEDMVVEELGMKVFLLSNDVINKSNKDISQYPSGDFEALKKFLQDELA